MLNENLIRGIIHFKETTREIKSEAKHDFRCFKDKVLVIWKLIFSTHHQRYTKDLQDPLVENYQTLNILPIKLINF